jgi:serine O-acetyltransferase
VHTSLTTPELKRYVQTQLATFFPDGHVFDGADVDAALSLALERLEFCFSHIAVRGYAEDGQVRFSHLHSDQYCHFIYLLSNSLWHHSQNETACNKLTVLNRLLHSVFLSYKIELPKIVHFAHAIGSVLGHAAYDDFLVVFQNVTINTSSPPIRIGKGVVLSAGVTVVGDQDIGARSAIGANTLLFNREIPPDSIVFTDVEGVQQIRKRTQPCSAQRFFNVEID